MADTTPHDMTDAAQEPQFAGSSEQRAVEAAPDDYERTEEQSDDSSAPMSALEAAEEEHRQEEARAPMLATGAFAEQMADVTSNLTLKSHAGQAVRYLLRLMDTRAAEVSVHPGIVGLLGKIIAEGPSMPAAGAAMMVLARMCLEPESRARVRAEATLAPMMRFLSMADPEKSVNAEAAALLLLNLASDRLARRALVTAGAIEALLTLSAKPRAPESSLDSYLAAALIVLVTADDSARVQQRFVEAGGIEGVCKSLGDRPRNDSGCGSLRLRLLLAELCRANKAWESRVYQAAVDSAPSRVQPVTVQQAAAAPTSAA